MNGPVPVATGAARRSNGRSRRRGRHVRPWSAEVAAQRAVPSPGPASESRRSYQIAPSRPSPPTASVGRNGCADSWTSGEAALHVRPPSLEPLVQMADVPSRRFSNQPAYAQPAPAAAATSWPNDRMVVPLSGSVVWVTAKEATVTGAAHVVPPSVERRTPTWPSWFVSSGEPWAKTSRRMPAAGASSSLFCVSTRPPGVSVAGAVHVAPWSSLRAKATWSPPFSANRAQTAYTRPARLGSARIDGLSRIARGGAAESTTTGAPQPLPPSRDALTTIA